MGDHPTLLRREVLEIGGSLAAMSGCLQESGGNASSKDPEAYVDDPEKFVDVEGVDGSVVKTDHLLTQSRNADVVVWKDDEGTVYADGENEVVASGESFTTVVQAAADNDASNIVIQDGHYVADGAVDLNSDTIVEGMGTDTTIEVAGSAGFNVKGERQASTPLTEDVSVDSRYVSVQDSSAFETDELVLVTTDRTTEYRDQPYGEIRRITAVDDANGRLEVTAGGLFDEYRVENNARAVAIEPVENVVVKNMELVGTDQQAYRSGVVGAFGQRVMVQNVLCRGLAHSGVIYSSCIYSAVDNCKMHDIGYENGGVGYGVTLADAVRNVHVRNNVFNDTKNHCTTVGGSGQDGYPRLLTFKANEYFEDDADVHMGGVVKFQDNRFANGQGGILTGADTTYVTGCTFRNLESAAIRNRGNPSELVVADSQFKDVDGMALNLYTNPTGFSKVTVAGNDFTDIENNVMRFRTPDGATCEFLGVTENVVNDCGGNAFHVGELGDSSIENANFVGNHFEAVDGFAVGAGSLSGSVRFLTNTVSNAGEPYAVILGGSMALVGNNDLSGYGDRGILVRSPGLVAGNTFSGGGNDAILVYETSDVFVTHNKFENTSGADVNQIGSSDCMVVQNDVSTYLDVSGSSNHVRDNFGYQTEDSGTHTASGNGSYSYEIPHDLADAAVIANVWAESEHAAGSFYVSGKDANSVTVTYENAPPQGSGNLSWGYEVRSHTN